MPKRPPLPPDHPDAILRDAAGAALIQLALTAVIALAGVTWNRPPPPPVHMQIALLPAPAMAALPLPAAPPPPTPTPPPPPPPPTPQTDITRHTPPSDPVTVTATQPTPPLQTEAEKAEEAEKAAQEQAKKAEEEALAKAAAEKAKEEARQAEEEAKAAARQAEAERREAAREAAAEARRLAEEAAEAKRQAALDKRQDRIASKYAALIINRIDDYLKTPTTVPNTDRIVVVLQIRLARDGSLDGIPTVIEPSGYPEYDDAAIRAVLQAAPLPIPKDRFIHQDEKRLSQFLNHTLRIRPR